MPPVCADSESAAPASVKEQVKSELQQRQLETGGEEFNFSTEIAQRWARLSAGEKGIEEIRSECIGFDEML